MFWFVDEEKVLSAFDFQCVHHHPEGYHETDDDSDDLGIAREFVHKRAAEQRAEPIHQPLPCRQRAHEQHIAPPTVFLFDVEGGGGDADAEC